MRVKADSNTVFFFDIHCSATLASQIVSLRGVNWEKEVIFNPELSKTCVNSGNDILFDTMTQALKKLTQYASSALFMKSDCKNETSCETRCVLLLRPPWHRWASTASLHRSNVFADHSLPVSYSLWCIVWICSFSPVQTPFLNLMWLFGAWLLAVFLSITLTSAARRSTINLYWTASQTKEITSAMVT